MKKSDISTFLGRVATNVYVGRLMMKELKRAVFVLLALLVLSAYGCSDGETTTTGGDEDMAEENTECVLAFADGLDGSHFGMEDDVDANTDGLQIDIEVSASSCSGDVVLHQVPPSGEEKTYTSSIEGDKATFVVTLEPGANVFKATVGDVESDSITIDNVICALAFVQPVDGATLTDADDKDPNADYLQYDVVVSASNIEDGKMLTLRIGPQPPKTVAIMDGVARFESVTIANGEEIPIIASAENQRGGACEASIKVNVNVSPNELCEVRLLPPTDTTFNAEADEDDATDGLQTTFTVRTTCNDSSMVTLNVNGVDVEAVQVSEQDGDWNIAHITVTLPEDRENGGASMVNAFVEEQTATTDVAKHGSLASAQRYFVDTVAPAITVDNLEDGQTISLASDEDDDTEGIQKTFSGSVFEPDESEEITISIDGVPYMRQPLTGTTGLGEQSSFEFADVTFTESKDYTITFTTQDAAGNVAEAEFTVHVVTEPPSIEIVKVGDTENEDGITEAVKLNSSDDADPDLPKLQTTIAAKGLNMEPGTRVVLRDGGVWVPKSATVDADGIATFNVDLADGVYTFYVVAVIPNYGQVESPVVEVEVNTQKPSVSYVFPQDGQYINQAQINVLLSATGVEAGNYAALTVNGTDTITGTVGTDEGGIEFSNVTLNDGDGVANTLSAVVRDSFGNESDPTEITVYVDTVPPTVAIVEPWEGQTIIDDAAPAQEGFQVRVRVGIIGEPDTSETGLKVRFVANDAYTVEQDLVSETSEAYMTVGDGANVIRVSYTDRAGNNVFSDVHFTVDSGCYNFAIVSPEPDTIFGLADDDDGDPSNGLLTDVVVTTDADQPRPVTPGTNVVLYINHGETNERMYNATMGNDGRAVFTGVRLDEGTSEVIAYINKDMSEDCYSQPVRWTVDFTAPTFDLTSPTLEDGVAKIDAQLPDADPFTEGFQAQFVFSTDAEDGAPAQMVLTQHGQQEVIDSEALNGSVTFVATLVDGITYSADAVIEDLAHNASQHVQFQIMVDRSVPELSITPDNTNVITLTDDENALEEDVQVSFTVQVTNGTVGLPVDYTITLVDDAGNPITDDNGDMVLQDSGSVPLENNRRATFQYTFSRSGFYWFELSHTDEVGNTGTFAIIYEVDIDAPDLELYDAMGRLMNEQYGTQVWNSSYDTSSNPGFQTDFTVIGTGMQEGATISICSNEGREVGEDDLGRCENGIDYKVGTAVVQMEGGRNIAHFYHLSMKNGVQHTVYAETRDEHGNYAKTPNVSVLIDSAPPVVDHIAINENDAANDSDIVILSANEGTLNGDSLTVSIDIVLSTADSEGETAHLFDGDTEIASGIVTNSEAIINGVVLSQGQHVLSVEVSDIHGNVNDRTAYTLTVFVDTIAPEVAFDPSSNDVIVLTSSDGTMDADGNLLVDISIKVSKAAGEMRTLNGTVVKLSGGVEDCTETVSGLGPNDTEATVVCAAYKMPQGSVTLSVVATDSSGNDSATMQQAYLVDSVPALAEFATPSGDTVYNATDDEDSNSANGLQRSDWSLNLSNVDGPTVVKVTYRSHSAGGDFSGVLFERSDVAANGPLALGQITFNQGVWDVRIETTDEHGNTFQSDPILITVDMAVPAVVLERSDGDRILGDADDLTNGSAFVASYDNNCSGAEFCTNIAIVTDAEDGSDTQLFVNGTLVPASQTTNGTGKVESGVVIYTNVALLHMPATNTIRAVVTTAAGNSGSVEVSGIMADREPPTGNFTVPAAEVQWSMADDADGLAEGLQHDITVSTNGVEDGVDAVLKVFDGEGNELSAYTASAQVSGNSVTFSSFTMPAVTSSLPGGHIVLHAILSDKTGNTAEITSANIEIDITPPQTISDAVACVGENTSEGATEGDPGFEPDMCGEDSMCGDPANSSMCMRRLGRVLLGFTAPNDEGSGIADYKVRWIKGSDATVCDGFDWDSATEDDTKVSVQTPLANSGEVQTIRIHSLQIEQNSYYCFAVRPVDQYGNEGAETKVARLIPIKVEQILSSSDTNFGTQILLEGDFNGDGLADVVVSTTGWGVDSSVLVHYGREDGGTAPLADWVVSGIHATDYFGYTLGAGDVNGDGIDDLVIGAGAQNVDDGSGGTLSFAGVIYVYFGSASGLTSDTQTVDGAPSRPADVVIKAENAVEKLGFSLTVLDYNGDGKADIAASAAKPNKQVNIYLGPLSAGTMVSSDADIWLTVPDENGFFARVLAHSDFDGDGKDDLIIPYDTSDYVLVMFGTNDDADLGAHSWSDSTPDPLVVKVESPYGSGKYFGASVAGLYSPKDGTSGGMVVNTRDDVCLNRVYYGTDGSTTITDSGVDLDVPGDDISHHTVVGFANGFMGSGYTDVAVLSSTMLRIFFGSASGYAQNSHTDIVPTGVQSIKESMGANGDFNGDGMPDISIGGLDSNNESVILIVK